MYLSLTYFCFVIADKSLLISAMRKEPTGPFFWLLGGQISDLQVDEFQFTFSDPFEKQPKGDCLVAKFENSKNSYRLQEVDCNDEATSVCEISRSTCTHYELINLFFIFYFSNVFMARVDLHTTYLIE